MPRLEQLNRLFSVKPRSISELYCSRLSELYRIDINRLVNLSLCQWILRSLSSMAIASGIMKSPANIEGRKLPQFYGRVCTPAQASEEPNHGNMDSLVALTRQNLIKENFAQALGARDHVRSGNITSYGIQLLGSSIACFQLDIHSYELTFSYGNQHSTHTGTSGASWGSLRIVWASQLMTPGCISASKRLKRPIQKPPRFALHLS